jgi:hypothetical protein
MRDLEFFSLAPNRDISISNLAAIIAGDSSRQISRSLICGRLDVGTSAERRSLCVKREAIAEHNRCQGRGENIELHWSTFWRFFVLSDEDVSKREHSKIL